jgi:hypothetical protein
MILKSVVIYCGGSWGCSCRDKVLEYKPGQTELEFELPRDIEWIVNSKFIDGPTFDVIVHFENSTGTRKETIQLVPELL